MHEKVNKKFLLNKVHREDAGGAQFERFFDLNAFLNSSNVHLPSPKYLMQPTIDLTCCCKKDLEVNLRIIFSLSFFIETLFKVLTGDFAPQEEARNVEKS